MGTANKRREKSLLMKRMAYARKQISGNGKKKWEKEIVHFSLEIYSNTTWEVGEQGSFLDFLIRVYIHYSTAQTGESTPPTGFGLLRFTCQGAHGPP